MPLLSSGNIRRLQYLHKIMAIRLSRSILRPHRVSHSNIVIIRLHDTRHLPRIRILRLHYNSTSNPPRPYSCHHRPLDLSSHLSPLHQPLPKVIHMPILACLLLLPRSQDRIGPPCLQRTGSHHYPHNSRTALYPNKHNNLIRHQDIFHNRHCWEWLNSSLTRHHSNTNFTI